MPLEEWNDYFQQILPSPYDVSVQMFLVVVLPCVHQDLTYPKKLLQFLQARDALRALRYSELMRYLEAEFVALAIVSRRLPDEAD